MDLFLTNCHNSFQHTKVISTGLSDCQKMIVTVLKTTFKKAKPKEIVYCSYKHYDKMKVRSDLKQKLSTTLDNYKHYSHFETTFLNVLNDHDPLKKKIVCANKVPYMTKSLRKAILQLDGDMKMCIIATKQLNVK